MTRKPEEKRATAVPPPEMSAALDVERIEAGGLSALADASGLHAETIAKVILGESVYKGTIARMREFLATRGTR